MYLNARMAQQSGALPVQVEMINDIIMINGREFIYTYINHIPITQGLCVYSYVYILSHVNAYKVRTYRNIAYGIIINR